MFFLSDTVLTHSEHVRNASGMRAGRDWDTCECYFGAELYRMYNTAVEYVIHRLQSVTIGELLSRPNTSLN